nr:hypothetical protein CFP56_33731 [Quercus suber]
MKASRKTMTRLYATTDRFTNFLTMILSNIHPSQLLHKCFVEFHLKVGLSLWCRAADRRKSFGAAMLDVVIREVDFVCKACIGGLRLVFPSNDVADIFAVYLSVVSNRICTIFDRLEKHIQHVKLRELQRFRQSRQV